MFCFDQLHGTVDQCDRISDLMRDPGKGQVMFLFQFLNFSFFFFHKITTSMKKV